MIHPEKINLSSARVTGELKAWLERKANLSYTEAVDAAFVIRDQGEIIATASRSGNVFKYFAIDPAWQGQNLSASLLGALMDDAFARGIYHYFIFTAPDKAPLFQGSGFQLIYRDQLSALLEGGDGSIRQYLAELRIQAGEPAGRRGSIVMNLNPLTLGHLYLIEEARRRVDELIIFIVEEDLSVFPFADRLAMARAATAHLDGVRVLPGGPYLISRATFPTYFLKQANADLTAYTTLDAGIFSQYYAPALGISSRFVGEEPLDPVTAAYNEALSRELARHGIEFTIIPRRQLEGQVISASRVRRHLARGETEAAFRLVPESTRTYLLSPEGQAVIQRIRQDLTI